MEMTALLLSRLQFRPGGKCCCHGPLMTGTRERRMIRDLVLNAQTAEPAIRQVDLDLAAEQPFRADREHIADDEHPDHQHRIDRGPPNFGIVGHELVMHPR